MCIMNTDIPAVAEEPPVGIVLANGGSQTSPTARGASPALPCRDPWGPVPRPRGSSAPALRTECWPCGSKGWCPAALAGLWPCRTGRHAGTGLSGLPAHTPHPPSPRNPSFAPSLRTKSSLVLLHLLLQRLRHAVAHTDMILQEHLIRLNYQMLLFYFFQHEDCFPVRKPLPGDRLPPDREHVPR